MIFRFLVINVIIWVIGVDENFLLIKYWRVFIVYLRSLRLGYFFSYFGFEEGELFLEIISDV